MSRTTLPFPAYSLRNLKTPAQKAGYRNHIAVVEVQDLPDLSKWRRINVRDPKLSGALPREIQSSFLGSLDTFVFLNRGIVLAVDSVEFQKNRGDDDSGIVKLTMSDPDIHGLLDGGHTYQIIWENRSVLAERGSKQYVKVEIIEGFDSKELVSLVDARNSSNQVKDESLMNLAHDFDKIKKVLKDEPYADLIAYKEYETFDDGTPKPIEIREIVSLLMAMDREHFTGWNHPINSYRSKAACLKHFEAVRKDGSKTFEKIYPLTRDLLRLWDTIHLRLPEFYNQIRGEAGEVSGGRFGRLTGVMWFNPAQSKKTQPLYFLQAESQYMIPAGLKYPIFASFRALLEDTGKRYEWGKGIDPIAFFEEKLGKRLAANVGEAALEHQNPSKTGKSLPVWTSCYQAAENEYLRLNHR